MKLASSSLSTALLLTLAIFGLASGMRGGCTSETEMPGLPVGPSAVRHPDFDPARHSALWGVEGELWDPSGRLPDFSWAGYAGGERPPDVPTVRNVTDFGAVGDGVTDDTEAFLRALEDAPPGAILVPAGRYRLLQPLVFDRSGIVLRGEGPEHTTLYFPRPLSEALGVGPYGGPHGWAWGGGWLWAKGEPPQPSTAIAEVTEHAPRGSSWLKLSTTDGLRVGDHVRLLQSEREDSSLSLHLHHGNPLQGRCWIDRPGNQVDWTVRVVEIDGDSVRLEQHLRVDVALRWSPELHPSAESVHHVGIEELTVEFPDVPYAGHHLEPGYNAVYFSHVADSWVRNVRAVHSDTAISFWDSRASTAEAIEVAGRGGHYGINLAASQDCLVTDFRITNRSLHDLSVAVLANGNVFSRGKGQQINFDHHRGAPHENLFTDIDVGASWRRGRLWDSSFTETGHYTAARETLWNIRPKVSDRRLPAWPQLNIIGKVKRTETPQGRSLDDLWIEPLTEPAVPDLYRAQRQRRIDSTRPE